MQIQNMQTLSNIHVVKVDWDFVMKPVDNHDAISFIIQNKTWNVVFFTEV